MTIHVWAEAVLASGLSGAMIGLAVLLVRELSPQARYRFLVAHLGMAAMTGWFLTVALRAGMRMSSPDRPLTLSGADGFAGASWADWTRMGDSAAEWVGWAWLAGMCVMCVRVGASAWGVRRLRRTALSSVPPEWGSRFRQCCERAGIRRQIGLRASALVESPIVQGWWRPAIFVPIGFWTALPPRQVEAVLYHELAHIQRWDPLLNYLPVLTETILFFHPVAWWLSRMAAEEREKCCDDLARHWQGDGRDLAEALVAMTMWKQTRASYGFAAKGSNMKNRVLRLMGRAEERTPAAGWGMAAFCLMLLMAPAIAQSIGGSGSAWVEQDVAYLIEAPEKKRFLELKTEPERQQFITQFWLRRDPTPGTPRNEFREEHYRRIAYANQKWTKDSVAGWKTDTGRVYIVYGPPDEIEVHDRVKQQWLYRSIPAIGKDVIISFTYRNNRYEWDKDPSVRH